MTLRLRQRWTPLDVASEAAITLEDLGIIDVYQFIGVSASQFGWQIIDELTDQNEKGERNIRPIYANAARLLFAHSSIRNDIDFMLKVLIRLAANQYFLRRAQAEHAPPR